MSVPESGVVEAASIAVGVISRIGIVHPVGALIGNHRLFLNVSRLVIVLNDYALALDNGCRPLNVGFALFIAPEIGSFGRGRDETSCNEDRKGK